MKKGINKFISVYIIVSFALTMLMPFSVSAESVDGSSPIIGVNITITDWEREYVYRDLQVTLDDNADQWHCKTFASSSNACTVYQSRDSSGTVVNHQITGDLDFSYTIANQYVYSYEFILNANYVGSITISENLGATTAKTYYVNGNSFTMTLTSLSTTFTVTSYSLYRNDLGNVWNFPIESFPWCSYLINNLFNRYYGLNQYNSYTFPIFEVQPGDIIFSGNTAGQWTWDLILYVNRSVNGSNLTGSNPFITSSIGHFENWTMINRFNLNGTLGYLFKVQLTGFGNNNSSNPFTLTWTGGSNNYSALIMPIYFNPVYETSFISTDFALNFGLSNRLLDYLEIIASSTPQTENSVDNMDDQTSNLTTVGDDYIGLEDDFSSGFSDSLQDVPSTFNFQTQFGQKFSSSANWVRTQFNNLTVGNPFGSLITFSLILGLALLLIGRRLL